MIQADLTGAIVECVRLTEGGGVRKLLLRIRSQGVVVVEVRLAPAGTADLAAQLQEVIDWLAEQ